MLCVSPWGKYRDKYSVRRARHGFFCFSPARLAASLIAALRWYSPSETEAEVDLRISRYFFVSDKLVQTACEKQSAQRLIVAPGLAVALTDDQITRKGGLSLGRFRRVYFEQRNVGINGSLCSMPSAAVILVGGYCWTRRVDDGVSQRMGL